MRPHRSPLNLQVAEPIAEGDYFRRGRNNPGSTFEREVAVPSAITATTVVSPVSPGDPQGEYSWWQTWRREERLRDPDRFIDARARFSGVVEPGIPCSSSTSYLPEPAIWGTAGPEPPGGQHIEPAGAKVLCSNGGRKPRPPSPESSRQTAKR